MEIEKYFRKELAEGKIDHALRISENKGTIVFYIHPDKKNGMTKDYIVNGNSLIPNNPEE